MRSKISPTTLPKDAVPKTLKKLRELKGWSQGDLCRATGNEIGRKYISRLELGYISDPRLSTLMKFARAFGMSCGELCDFVIRNGKK